MKKPTLKTLPNGLRLLVIPEASAPTATALVLVGTGSNYEKDTEQGLSHFLEHMYFKGTTTMPTSKIIMERLDKIGALSNAFTSNEYTGYYAKGAPKHLPTFVEILGDIYCNATFPEGEIEKEKGVIVEEINMYEDMPQYKVAEVLATLMYGDQPAGLPIIGTKKSVRSFGRADFLAYKKKHYHAANTMVIIAGAVQPQEAYRLVAQAFGSIDNKPAATKKKVHILKKSPTLAVVERPIDQVHLAIGFHGFRAGHRESAATALLVTLLGRGMSSRLFQVLREEMGAAYYVGAAQESFTDHGVVDISAGIDRTRVGEVLTRVAGMLHELTTTLVTPSELAKAREYALGVARLGLESSDEIAGFYGIQLLVKGAYKTLADIARDYRTVTPADVRRIARTLFTPDNTHIALVGACRQSEIDMRPFRSL